MNEKKSLATALKEIPLKHRIGLAVVAVGLVAMFSETAYYQHRIQGNWACRRADGSFGGGYAFGDAKDYVMTVSRNLQYFGDYKVSGKEITTTIVGTTVGFSPYTEDAPLISKIDYVERSGDYLIIKVWPADKPLGVALSCEPMQL